MGLFLFCFLRSQCLSVCVRACVSFSLSVGFISLSFYLYRSELSASIMCCCVVSSVFNADEYRRYRQITNQMCMLYIRIDFIRLFVVIPIQKKIIQISSEWAVVFGFFLLLFCFIYLFWLLTFSRLTINFHTCDHCQCLNFNEFVVSYLP